MKRFFKWAAVAVGVLFITGLIVSVCGYLWMRYWGPYDEKQAIREILAKGEKLNLGELLPQRPADDQNFYGDPIWLELADMVPSTENFNGVTYETFKPRLPADKLQINRWKTSLSSEEQKALQMIKADDETKERKRAIRDILSSRNAERNHALSEEDAQTLLLLLSPADQFTERVRSLSKKPNAVFPNHYIGFHTPQPHIMPILEVATLLEAHARAELRLGKTEYAAEDIGALIRIAQLMRWHPSWIESLVKNAVVSTALRPICEGIVRNAWPPLQLAGFEQGLSSINLPEDLSWALRSERAMMFATDLSKPLAIAMPAMPNFFMSPLFLRYDRGHGMRFSQKFIDTLDDYDRSEGLNEKTVRHLHMPWGERCLYPYAEDAHLNILNLIQGASEKQTQINQTVIACALERYRISHGSYPVSFDALVPEYLTKIPNSPITGKAMNYSLNPDGTFLLWSPGWNLKTLGGKPGEFKGDGDIVWGKTIPMKTKQPLGE
jgi:hypothetical protein